MKTKNGKNTAAASRLSEGGTVVASKRGSSIGFVIPSKIVKAHNINPGDPYQVQIKLDHDKLTIIYIPLS